MEVRYKATESLARGVVCALGKSTREGVILLAADARGWQLAPSLELLLHGWASRSWLHRTKPLRLRVAAVMCLPAGVDVAMVEGEDEAVFLLAADSTGALIAEAMNDVAVPWVREEWVHVGSVAGVGLRSAS